MIIMKISLKSKMQKWRRLIICLIYLELQKRKKECLMNLDNKDEIMMIIIIKMLQPKDFNN